jgi:hypothetical protein
MLKEILEQYDDEEILVADGFDEAVIGIATDFMEEPRVIYSVTKCIEILMTRDKMDYTEAMEYFTYNVSGGWLGPKTPIWCWDDFE